MHFDIKSGVLALIRLLLGRGESGHSHVLGTLPDCKHCCHSFSHTSKYIFCSTG